MAYYLDLYNGDPQNGGASVLAAITGSATRTDITDDLVEVTSPTLPFRGHRLTNLDVVTVTTASENVSNVNFAVLYTASNGGSLLYKSSLGAFPVSINKGNPVQFDALGLTFSLS